METEPENKFRKELETLINCHSKENGSDTPDFILAQYLDQCLKNFDRAVYTRDCWYGRDKKEAKRIASEADDFNNAY